MLSFVWDLAMKLVSPPLSNTLLLPYLWIVTIQQNLFQSISLNSDFSSVASSMTALSAGTDDIVAQSNVTPGEASGVTEIMTIYMGSRDIYKSGDCYIGEFKDGCSHEHGWFAYIAIIHNSLTASFVTILQRLLRFILWFDFWRECLLLVLTAFSHLAILSCARSIISYLGQTCLRCSVCLTPCFQQLFKSYILRLAVQGWFIKSSTAEEYSQTNNAQLIESIGECK